MPTIIISLANAPTRGRQQVSYLGGYPCQGRCVPNPKDLLFQASQAWRGSDTRLQNGLLTEESSKLEERTLDVDGADTEYLSHARYFKDVPIMTEARQGGACPSRSRLSGWCAFRVGANSCTMYTTIWHTDGLIPHAKCSVWWPTALIT